MGNWNDCGVTLSCASWSLGRAEECSTMPGHIMSQHDRDGPVLLPHLLSSLVSRNVEPCHVLSSLLLSWSYHLFSVTPRHVTRAYHGAQTRQTTSTTRATAGPRAITNCCACHVQKPCDPRRLNARHLRQTPTPTISATTASVDPLRQTKLCDMRFVWQALRTRPFP